MPETHTLQFHVIGMALKALIITNETLKILVWKIIF